MFTGKRYRNEPGRFWKKIRLHCIRTLLIAVITIMLVEISYSHFEKMIRYFKSKIFQVEIINEFIISNNGIPIVDYGMIMGIDIGLQIVPVAVCRTALKHYDNYISGDADAYHSFMNCVEWLIDEGVRTDSLIIFPHHFPFPLYQMNPPWQSAMAQGQALQVMIRAHELSAENRFLSFADSLVNSLFREVDHGGFTLKWEHDSWWYEEYVDPAADSSMVLNGMMYTLLGLREYYQYTNSEPALKLFRNGLKAVEQMIPEYDRHGHSYYDIRKNPAGGKYHQIHTSQLLDLYQTTNSEILFEYYQKWNKFQSAPYLIQLVTAPPKMLIGVYCLAFLIVLCSWGLVRLIGCIFRRPDKNYR
ncbi:MAG: hypothetical protein JW996_05045 [Candidatus Cloacimonetes bacterium]|nr:hypothetical protein [Candidatus Cloacimonadota bacterium]